MGEEEKQKRQGKKKREEEGRRRKGRRTMDSSSDLPQLRRRFILMMVGATQMGWLAGIYTHLTCGTQVCHYSQSSIISVYQIPSMCAMLNIVIVQVSHTYIVIMRAFNNGLEMRSQNRRIKEHILRMFDEYSE